MPFELSEDLIEETFLAATGPGGQNVNKVATACQLRVNIYALGLPPFAYKQLKDIAGSRLASNGDIIVTARSSRSREANREEARTRMVEMIDKAFIRAPRRIATKPSKAAKARRVDVKKGRSAVKSARQKPRLD